MLYKLDTYLHKINTFKHCWNLKTCGIICKLRDISIYLLFLLRFQVVFESWNNWRTWLYNDGTTTIFTNHNTFSVLTILCFYKNMYGYELNSFASTTALTNKNNLLMAFRKFFEAKLSLSLHRHKLVVIILLLNFIGITLH